MQNVISSMVEPKCKHSWIIANRCGNIIQKCMHHGIATYMQETVIVFYTNEHYCKYKANKPKVFRHPE